MSSSNNTDVKQEINPSLPIYVYIAIGTIGILIMYLLVYSTMLGTRSVRNLTALVGTVNEIRFEATLAHLWSEEILSNDPSVKEKDIWTHYELIDKKIHLLENELKAKFVSSKEVNDTLISMFDSAHKSLDTMIDITELRLNARNVSAPGSKVDQVFDESFLALLDDLGGLKKAVLEVVDDEIGTFRRTQTIIIVVILILSGVVGIVIRSFDKKRSEHIRAIRDMNLNLEAVNHQLSASEQQLRATNQQLRASEQQAKASEQQLRATNQQLMASEQQLRASEESLRWSKEHYRTIFTTAPNLILSLDIKGKIIECNGRSRDILGYEAQEMIGQPFDQYIASDSDSASWFKLEKIKNGQQILNKELRLRTKDGDIAEIRMNASTMKGSDSLNDMTVCIIEDVTKLNRFQQEIQNIQKLESLGVMAGGIAHDFNNLLTAIVANISLARLALGSGSKADLRLADAEVAADRAKDLSHQLLTFSKGGEPVKQTAHIGDLVSESASFAFRGTNTACDISIPQSIWMVYVDAGQITQVLHNLFINADQAITGGGTVHVSCENTVLDSDNEVPPLSAGHYVRVSIRDNGTGISEEHIDRIFDPYYSTKQHGSGLGLAISHSIINKHDGHISVDSEPDKGTVFSIYLPASTEKEVVSRRSPETVPTGSGKVLVMDDEEAIRESTAEILNSIGYDVTMARDGNEAIDIVRASQGSEDRFNVVLLDLTIPGDIGGRDIIEDLIEIDPDVKAIVMSGYSNDSVLSNYRQYGFHGALLKPFKVSDIAQALSNVMKS
jgi:PAS domain S-box-containing protein